MKLNPWYHASRYYTGTTQREIREIMSGYLDKNGNLVYKNDEASHL